MVRDLDGEVVVGNEAEWGKYLKGAEEQLWARRSVGARR
jgi:hypothetical protein